MSKVGFHVGDINIEFNEVSVKLIVTIFQKSVVFAFELLNISLEFFNNGLNVFQVMLFKGLKLLDGAE